MSKPQWITSLLDEMKKAGKVPTAHTGKVTLVINVSQGSFQDCDLSVAEKIK